MWLATSSRSGGRGALWCARVYSGSGSTRGELRADEGTVAVDERVVLSEVGEQALDGQEPGWAQPDRRLVARPRPFADTLAQLCSQRVAEDVADGGEQVFVLLHEERAVAALEEVAVAAVAAVEALGVDTVQVPHAAGEVRLRRLHEQVVVVRHQAVREPLPAVALAAERECLEEALAVCRVPVDRLALVPTCDDVEDSVCELDAGRACDPPTLAPGSGGIRPAGRSCGTEGTRLFLALSRGSLHTPSGGTWKT